MARSDKDTANLRSFESTLRKYDRARYRTLPEASIEPDDLAAIYTTSGTTSFPKLVPCTQRMYIANLANSNACKYLVLLLPDAD